MRALEVKNGELNKSISHCELYLTSSQNALISKETEIGKMNAELNAFKAQYSGQFIDESFFDLVYEQRQLATPVSSAVA